VPVAASGQGSGRGPLENIGDAFRISRQAGGGLFVVATAVPILEGLLAVAQLVALRYGAKAFLSVQGSPRDALAHTAPWLAAAVLIFVAALVADNANHLLRELLAERVKRLTASRMHAAIAQLELLDFDDPVVHDRISRSEATAEYRPTQVVRAVTTLLTAAFRVIALTVFLLILQPLLVPAVLLGAIPMLVISARLARDRYGFFTVVTLLERRRRYVGWLISGRQPAAEVRSFRLTQHLSRRYDALSKERLDELRQMLKAQWRSMMIGQLTFALIVTFGISLLAWFYGTGRLSTPELLAAVLGLTQLAGSLGTLGGPVSELAEASLFLADQDAFYRQITAAGQARRTDRRPDPLREIRVRDLSFRYPSSDRPALVDIDLTIAAGQFVAFVGPNGSGKTTLAKLLAGLYPAPAGSLRWNGVDVGEYEPEALRDRVTAVFQEHMTYQVSVADNVALGDITREPDEAAVRQALGAAGMARTVERLPDGVDTQLGPEFDGTSLSGGEAQRLAIARAFFRRRELVVLDEPTAALDAHADHALLGDLRTRLRDRTVVLISHRFSNVRAADQIFVFREGRIIERGTHESLLATGGLYAEMYSLQASMYGEQSLLEPT
jgi:ATP-binding cassette, subfamily B, bacterial